MRHPSHLAEYAAARDAHQYDKALAIIRAEIASPSIPARDSYIVSLYAIGIAALGNFVGEGGATPDIDAEAMRYHDREAAMCLEERERGDLAHLMALYYSHSRRNGLALKWVYDERVIWAAGHDEFRRI